MNYSKGVFGGNLNFHYNLSIANKTQTSFSALQKVITALKSKRYSSPPNILSSISSHFLWFNSFIKTEKRLFVLKQFFLVICFENGKIKILAKNE